MLDGSTGVLEDERKDPMMISGHNVRRFKGLQGAFSGVSTVKANGIYFFDGSIHNTLIMSALCFSVFTMPATNAQPRPLQIRSLHSPSSSHGAHNS